MAPNLPPALMALLDDDFWRSADERMKRILIRNLTNVSSYGVDEEIDELIDLDQSLVVDNAPAYNRAAEWVRDHAQRLLEPPRGISDRSGNISETTRNSIVEAIATWLDTPGGDVEDLTEDLDRVLGENKYRARMIAVSEVTRATAAGRDAARQEAGFPPTAFIPPLHPNCRCDDRGVILSDGTRITVWQTQRDEFVCTEPQPGPGGATVNGCSGMHDRVISEGEFYGMKLSEVE